MAGEPEEMSMNEVLSSIRQMLSDDEMKESDKLDEELDDIFVLTPAMRVSEASASDIQEKMRLALTKLAEQKSQKTPEDYQKLVKAELQPILKDWLKEQLPALIEQALNNEINKLFG